MRQVTDRKGANFDKRFLPHPYGPCLSIEALALARWTAHGAHVFFELQTARTGGGFFEAAQELGHEAFPLVAVFPNPAAPNLPLESDVAVAGAVQEPILVRTRQVAPGGFQVDPQGFGHAVVYVLAPAAHAPERPHQGNGTLVKTQGRIGNEGIRIEGVARAEPVAIQAHALRAVEAE